MHRFHTPNCQKRNLCYNIKELLLKYRLRYRTVACDLALDYGLCQRRVTGGPALGAWREVIDLGWTLKSERHFRL
jgi:hypothetical protein